MKNDRSRMLVHPNMKRPLSVTVFCVLVLILSITSLVRLVQALVQWDFLSQLLGYFPIYIAFSGLLWALLNFGVFLLTFIGWHRGRWLVVFWLCALSVYYWVDRIMISANQEILVSWTFAAFINLLLFLWIFFFLSRPKVKRYFEETNE
jgi:hypothetical protein